MTATSPVAGRWEFLGAFLHRGRAVGPTHEFETAEEFIDLNDANPDAGFEWGCPAARVVEKPGPSWLELRDDGSFAEHEELNAGPRRWWNGGPVGETDERGAWESTSGEFAANLVPEFVHQSLAPVYFDQVAVESSGGLYRRIVSVVDGLYVDYVRAYYRRAGAAIESSPVERFVRERVSAIRAFGGVLSAGGDAEIKAAAGADFVANEPATADAFFALQMAAGQREDWACAPAMIEEIGRIRDEVRAIPQRSAPYKSSIKLAIEGYFDQLREVGIEVPEQRSKKRR